VLSKGAWQPCVLATCSEYKSRDPVGIERSHSRFSAAQISVQVDETSPENHSEIDSVGPSVNIRSPLVMGHQKCPILVEPCLMTTRNITSPLPASGAFQRKTLLYGLGSALRWVTAWPSQGSETWNILLVTSQEPSFTSSMPSQPSGQPSGPSPSDTCTAYMRIPRNFMYCGPTVMT